MPSLAESSQRIWTSLSFAAWRSKSRLRLRLIGLALVGSASLSGCCGHRTTVLLDERIPHRVAEETTVVVWGKTPDGTYKMTAARLPAGWWVAAPAVVDEPGKP